MARPQIVPVQIYPKDYADHLTWRGMLVRFRAMQLTPNRRQFLRIVAAGAAYSGSGLAQSLATVFRSPYLQDVREDRATICWNSMEPGEGMVEYWDDSRSVRSATATTRRYPDGRFRFEAVLDNLTSASSYGYRVSVGGERVGVARFQTPGTPSFEFLAFGDSGTGSEVQAQLAKRMLQHTAAGFVLHTGDLVYPAGSYERYENLYFAYYQELMRNAPFFPCPGNHDYYETSCIPYRALHSVPGETVQSQDQGRYYSFDWGNAHFVSLDTNDSLFEAVHGSGDMLRWLEADLSASHKFWRIVMVHHSPYAEGAHSGEIEGKMIREHIGPILEKHAIPLVLNGHEHSYQRSIPIRGTTYITTGGGGAPLHAVTPSPLTEKGVSEHHYLSVAIDGANLQLKALRADGSLLDTWELAPQPVITSVVDAASFGPELAAGGLVSIFGHHLTADEGVVEGSVMLNGGPVAVLMASPSQINVQLPQVALGDATLSVRGPNGTASCRLNVQLVAPAIFEGALVRSTGTAVTDENPALPGELLTVYVTGLGSGAPSSKVGVEWNGTVIAPHSSVPVQGLAGVGAVTFSVPDAQFAEAQLHVIAGGKRSRPVRVPGRGA